MARSARTRVVDRTQSGTYLGAGLRFIEAADALSALASGNETYGNAMALLAIHGTIACTDGLTIRFGGRKSIDGNHAAVADLLRAVLTTRLPERTVNALRAVLSAKDAVSYQGKYYPLEQARLLLKKARAFASWAESMNERNH